MDHVTNLFYGIICGNAAFDMRNTIDCILKSAFDTKTAIGISHVTLASTAS